MIQARLGDLLRPRGDHWWKVTLTTNPVKLETELVRVLRDKCLPWLERACDYDWTIKNTDGGRYGRLRLAVAIVRRSRGSRRRA